MKNESVFFISGYVGWLKTTEFWQRMVVRSPKRRGAFLLYATVVFGVISWGDMLIDMNTPVLKFEELDKRIGVLQGAGYSGKNQNRWASLRQPDGQVVVYNASGQSGKIEPLQKLIGKPVTVYSQKQFQIIRLGNEELLMEMECEGKKHLNYDYERRLWIHQHFWSLGSAWLLAAIPALMIVLPLLALWHIGRYINELDFPINPTSGKE